MKGIVDILFQGSVISMRNIFKDQASIFLVHDGDTDRMKIGTPFSSLVECRPINISLNGTMHSLANRLFYIFSNLYLEVL
jgi:hypothetical protein